MEDVPRPVSELGLVQRILGTFTSPRRVFAYLDHQPRILGVLLVVIAVNMTAGYLVRDVAYQAGREKALKAADMSEEQLARVETSMKFMSKAAPVVAAATSVIAVYVLAAILLLIANVILRGSTSYRHLAAAMAHISLVAIPQAIVKVPLILAKGDTDIRAGLAAVLPRSTDSGFLYHLLSQFDVFTLWQLGLCAAAVAILARVRVRRAVFALVVAWVVWLLIWVPISTKLPAG